MLVRKIFMCENPHPHYSILVDDTEPLKDMEICPHCGIEYVSIITQPLNDKAVIRIENGVFYDNWLGRNQGEKSYFIVVTDFQGKEYCRAAHSVSWDRLVRHLEQLREMNIAVQ